MSRSLYNGAILTLWSWGLGHMRLPAQGLSGNDSASIPPMLELPHAKLPPPQINIEAPWPWWYYLIGAGALILLLWLLSVVVQGLKGSGQKAKAHPIVKARKALNQLQSEAENLRMDELSHRVSALIREYQHEKYLIPYHCQTMEEIYMLTDQQPFERVKPIFQPLAERLEFISFSPNRETLDRKTQLLDDAREALESDAKLPLA